MRVIVGGLVIKDNKVLLVQEAKESCYGKWNITAGGLEDNESILEGAKREIREETGIEVEIKSLITIDKGRIENKDYIAFIFNTKLISENISFNKEEILDVKWFSIDDVLNGMYNELRNPYFIKEAIRKYVNNIEYPLDIIEDTTK